MSVFRVIGLSIVAMCAASSAFAQEPEEAVREAAERETRAAELREEALEYRGGSIAFGQVLAAPDDVRLNLAYAREQIAGGDLKEGAATLERILLLQPQLHDVRVLYGLVLYRLGLLDRARFELENALTSELAPTVRAEAELYLERIKRLQRKTRGTLTLTAGAEWDQNRNQAPSSGTLLFFDIPLSAEPQDADYAWITSVQGKITHDLGVQAGHTVHGEASYYRSDKNEIDSLDIDAVSLGTGFTFNFGDFAVSPRARGSFIWLSGEDYLTTYGGELEFLYRFRPTLRAYLNLRGEHEEFRDVTEYLSASLRTGRRFSARPGVMWNFSPTMALTAEGLWMDKQGETEFESFDRYGVFAQHTWLHGGGVFTLIGGWAERSAYDGVDIFVSPSTAREEWLYRARFTAGAPLSWFLRGVDMPRALSTINLIAQYEYEKVDSNIPNFDYDTHKVSLLLSKRITF
ncbi:MAG: surface lipoprotein assembly modifier [Amphiplicatus sp.]